MKFTVVKNFASLGLMQAINYLLPIILTPYLVVTIGISNVGIIATMTAFAAYFQLLIDYGFNLTATREIARNSSDNEYLSRITSAVINIKVMFSILVVVFSIIISQFSFYFSQYFQVYIFTILLVISQSLFPVWHFQGVQQMQYITLCNSIPKIMAAIMVFVLIKKADDTWKVQFIYFCGGVLSLLFSYSILFCKFRFVYKFNLDDIRFHLKDGMSVFTARLASGLYKNFNILALGYFSTPMAVGVYSIAEKVLRGMQMVQNVLGDVLYPMFSKENKYREDFFKILIKKYWAIVFIFYLVATIIIYSASNIISVFLAKSSSYDVDICLKIMSAAFFFGGMNYIFAVLGLVSCGQTKVYAKCVILTGVFNVIVSTLLSYEYSYEGASLALVLSEIFLFVLVIFKSKKTGII